MREGAVKFNPGDIIVGIGCYTRRVVVSVSHSTTPSGSYLISNPVRDVSPKTIECVMYASTTRCFAPDIDMHYVKVGHWNGKEVCE